MPTVYGHPVEILSIQRARCALEGPQNGQPLCLFMVRPAPDENLESAILLLSQEQCIRLRDTLNEFLNDKESWLYLPRKRQKALRFQFDTDEVSNEQNP